MLRMRSNSIMQFNVPLHWEEACYPDGWRNTRDSEQAKSLASISTHHRFWHIWEVSRHWSKTEMKENAVVLVSGILLRMGSYTLQVWSPFRGSYSESQNSWGYSCHCSLWCVKPAMRETWAWSLGWEDSLEKEKATHSKILAWRIPWTL